MSKAGDCPIFSQGAEKVKQDQVLQESQKVTRQGIEP
jgi:hypothetical protein